MISVTAFQARKASRIASSFLMGLVAIAVGILLLFDPLGKAVALTLVLAAFFLANGALRLYFVWKMMSSPGWGWLLFGGVLSLALGIVIFLGLPGIGFWSLGILVGVDLVFYGVALIAVLINARKCGEEKGQLASEAIS